MPSVHFFHHFDQAEKEAEDQDTKETDNEEQEEKPATTFPVDVWY